MTNRHFILVLTKHLRFLGVLQFWVILAIFFALISPAGATNDAEVNRPIKDKWAVVIGISNFANSAIPSLKYSSKDAQDFRDFLVQKGNFAADHVLLLKDAQASRERILDAFGDGWLPRRVMENDLVLIFISSHGSPADRAGENFVIAYDSNPDHPYATSIRLQDLASELSRRTGCDRLVLLLDACHSGAAAEGRKALIRSKTNFDLNAITGSGQLVISSSDSDQVSWESKRYQNGVFTHNLIKALQVDGQRTKIEQAYKVLKDKVELEVRYDRREGQTPMILSKWKGDELSLCALPAEPRKIPFSDDEPQPTKQQSKTSPAEKNSFTDGAGSSPDRFSSGSSSNPAARAQRSILLMTTTWQKNQGDPTLESGCRKINISQLAGLSYKELLFLYNEAYARHGRGFAMQSIQDYFNKQHWYAQDPDYHWRADDPRVMARSGQPDDALIINEKRTPIQWANMQIVKQAMSASGNDRSR